MNLKRILSTVVGLPIVILIFIFGNKYTTDIIIAVLAVMSMYEYINSFKHSKKAKPISWICYVACAIIAFLHVIPSDYLSYVIVGFVILTLFVLFLQVVITDLKTNITDIAVTILGICYIPLLFSFIALIYGANKGKFYIWFPVIVAWGTDIFAYIIGKRIGKHKFSPISPNKSIEGCVAGTLAAVILSVIYTAILNACFNFNINYIVMGVAAAVLSLVGQVGDFSASSIKRYNDVKDFSNLIPGHGGILDRFDSFIFIAPFAYFLLMLI